MAKTIKPIQTVLDDAERKAWPIAALLNRSAWPIAVLLNHYVRSGDIDFIDQMRETDRWFVSKDIAEAAVNEWDASPTATAIMSAVIHRINTRSQTVHDEFPGAFGRMCVTPESISRQLDKKFIEKLRDSGCSDLSIACFWIANAVTYAELVFYWRSNEYTPLELKYFSPEKYYVIPDSVLSKNAFEDLIISLPDADLLQLLKRQDVALGEESTSIEINVKKWPVGTLQAVVSRQRPHLMKQFIQSHGMIAGAIDWPFLTGATDLFDKECIRASELNEDVDSLIALDNLRGGKYKEVVIKRCIEQTCSSPAMSLLYLAENDQALMVTKLSECIAEPFRASVDIMQRCCQIAAERWDEGGSRVFTQFSFDSLFDTSKKRSERRCNSLVDGAIPVATSNNAVGKWLRDLLCTEPEPVEKQYEHFSLWTRVARDAPSVIESELWRLLQHKAKSTRNLAVIGLHQDSINNAVTRSKELLTAKSANARVGAVELLTAIGDEKAIAVLQAAAGDKHIARVRNEIIKSLEKLGYVQSLDSATSNESLVDIIAQIEARKNMKLPTSASWLDLSALPDLRTKDGNVLSEKILTHLVNVQAKHKSINPAPDIIQLLTHIDREKSSDFAIAIMNQWLATKQNAADRWVLTLAGLLGDKRILPVLTNPINGWAQAARHKLAEYAAQAVALVPAAESLMMLESLAQRYRRRFRNIGKACQAALQQSAEIQGVSMDELADIIVPTLDFNSDCQRALPETDILAVLQPDFKLSFYNPQNEIETTTLPSSLTDSARADVSTLKKFIRETVKSQTVRLEQSMVVQRAWPAKRWQELFEVNPFLQSYAARLVWMSLDSTDKPIRLFRRYSNGLLANAEGDLIELDESDASIVIAHPLNLSEQTRDAWSSHFTRMKIKPPFEQLKRPTAVLDANHGNRRILALTENHKMASGTFRSRAEKLGWTRGSVEDGARIYSYFKEFTGAQISAYILIDFMYIGQDPADEMTMGETVFVKHGSKQPDNRVGHEPAGATDPRVTVFNEVHPVVYSETLTDIQLIVRT